MTQVKLLVGLCNPGAKYAVTRHNAGAWWLEKICQNYQVTLTVEKKFSGLTAKIATADTEHPIYCLLPTTYMNLSGQAVSQCAQYYKIKPEEILVIHDDLDLPAGTIRLKQGGGNQGHNGLRDIVDALGSGNFNRLRIGIGHPGDKNAVLDYVLAAPSKAEKQQIDSAIENSMAVLVDIIIGNWQHAMHKLHSKSN